MKTDKVNFSNGISAFGLSSLRRMVSTGCHERNNCGCFYAVKEKDFSSYAFVCVCVFLRYN